MHAPAPPHSLPCHLTPSPTHTPTKHNWTLRVEQEPGKRLKRAHSCMSPTPPTTLPPDPQPFPHPDATQLDPEIRSLRQAPAQEKRAGAWNKPRLLLKIKEQEPGIRPGSCSRDTSRSLEQGQAPAQESRSLAKQGLKRARRNTNIFQKFQKREPSEPALLCLSTG